MIAWALANVPISVEGQPSQALTATRSADRVQKLSHIVADTLDSISDPYVKIHSQTKNV